MAIQLYSARVYSRAIQDTAYTLYSPMRRPSGLEILERALTRLDKGLFMQGLLETLCAAQTRTGPGGAIVRLVPTLLESDDILDNCGLRCTGIRTRAS